MTVSVATSQLGAPPDASNDLSFQQRLCLSHIHSGRVLPNHVSRVELSTAFSTGQVCAALQGTLARHGILCAVRSSNGLPIQLGSGDVLERVLSIVHLRDTRRSTLRDQADDFVRMPIDFAVDPPIRVRLLSWRDRPYSLVIAVHPLASDCESQHILMRDFCELLLAEHEERSSRLPPPSRSYRLYVEAQRRWFAEGQTRQMIRALAQALPPAAGRMNAERSRTRCVNGEEFFCLSPSLAAAAIRVTGREFVPPHFMGLAALALAVSRRSGSARVQLAVPVVARQAEDQQTVGLFREDVLIDLDLGAGDTFRDIFRQIIAITVSGAYGPCGGCAAFCAAEPALDTRLPQFQFDMALSARAPSRAQSRVGPDTHRVILDAIDERPLPAGSAPAPYELSVHWGWRGRELGLRGRFSTADPVAFDAPGTLRLVAQALESAVREPHRRLSQVI